MAQSFFIWNGIDCRSMGVIMQGPAPIVRGEERVEHVTIPGVAGELTLTEGADIYQSYIQTISIAVRGGYNVRNIYRWLRGSGYLTLSGEPDRKQEARVIGAVTLNKHSHNMDAWEGEVQFYCQPLKELLTGRNTSTASGGTVRNSGDVTERPEWSFKATGTSATVSAGGKTLEMTGLTVGGEYVILSGAQMVMTADRENNITRDSSGDFPVLEPGNNTVTGSGWATITIWRRERFL